MALTACPSCGAGVRTAQLACEVCGIDFDPAVRAEQRAGQRLDREDWQRDLSGCLMLGGAGIPFVVGDPVALHFDATGLTVSHALTTTAVSRELAAFSIRWPDVLRLSIEGPGKVTTGGGAIGGGFGVEGALTGIAIAGLLNALTTRSEILTIVHVELVAGEFFALYGGAEPHALRISLSPAFVACSKSVPDRRLD